MKSTVVGSHVKTNLLTGGSTADTRQTDLFKREECIDDVSPFPYIQANPLWLSKTKDGLIRANGKVEHGILGFDVSKDVYVGYPLDKLVPEFGAQSVLPLSNYTNTALARAIPNQSQTDLTELLVQLPQLKGSLLTLRKLFLEFKKRRFYSDTIGQAYIANEFGIAPLIRDLWDFIHIGEILNDASTAYNKAEKGVSTHGTLDKGKSEWDRKAWLTTTWSIHNFRITNKYSYKIWYSVRFRPNGTKSPYAEPNVFEYFGFDKPLVSLWNLTPWSFLVDYLVNVSDFITAGESSHKVRDICIMREQSAVMSMNPGTVQSFGLYKVKENTLRFDVRNASNTLKERKVFTDGFGIPLKPFLSGGQVANLVALLAGNNSEYVSVKLR